MGHLAEAANLLKQHKSLNLSVTGHADKDGSVEYNQDLAMGRAKQVERYLTIFGLSQTASKPKPLGKAFHCIKATQRLPNLPTAA